MSRSLQEQYKEAQGRLDKAHRQHKEEWTTFANNPSLPLPQGANIDDLQETASRLRMMLDKYEDVDDDDHDNDESDAPIANEASDTPISGFGQGLAYSPSLRSSLEKGPAKSADGLRPNAALSKGNPEMTLLHQPIMRGKGQHKRARKFETTITTSEGISTKISGMRSPQWRSHKRKVGSKLEKEA